jgi:hypothetical protein
MSWGLFAYTDKALIDAGLVQAQVTGNNSRLSLTEAGRKFAVGGVQKGHDPTGYYEAIEVVTEETQFAGVTGVTQAEGSNEATVEFTISHQTTPFGSIMLQATPRSENRKATFRKYDDGWRLESL